jgi:hypothetical protein
VTDQAVVGMVGSVFRTVRGGELPGEVRVVVGGLPHYYIAFCSRPLDVGVEVLVINNRGGRQIDVEPWSRTLSCVDVNSESKG